MKIQVLKMSDKYDFTVIKDTAKESTEQYEPYIHVWKMGKNGYPTKRRYLVDRVWSMDMCIAWIMDILRDSRCLRNAISADKLMSA